MHPLVSILIPAYNAERWLQESVRSALAQTWPNKEVVIVDDGSSDRTLAVAEGLRSDSVRVLSQRNGGASAARNAALHAARGDFIQWLDADDLLHPNKVSSQMSVIGGDRRGLATASWGRFFSSPELARFAPDSLWEPLSPAQWITRKFRDNTFMFPATWLVGRDLIDQAGEWDEQISLDDDGEYMCRLVTASRRVEFVPEARCYYRIGNTTSLSWRRSERALESAYRSMNLCVDRLLALENSDETRMACLVFVQAVHEQFHPERADLVEGCRARARELGGTLTAPVERPHFRLFRWLVGWEAAKTARARLAGYRLQAARLRETFDMWRQPSGDRAPNWTSGR